MDLQDEFDAGDNVVSGDSRRLHALGRLGIIGSPGDADFDEIVAYAKQSLGVPMAAISFVDDHQVWFKSESDIGVSTIPRDGSLCDRVIAADDLVVVESSTVPPTPLLAVGGHVVRAYAGVPIHVFGEAVGVLCVFDGAPRSFDAEQLRTLRFLGRQAEHLVALAGRRIADAPPPALAVEHLASRVSGGESFESVARCIDRAAWIFDAETHRFLAVNDVALERYGYRREEFLGLTVLELRPPSDRRVLAAALANSRVERYSRKRIWRHRRADGHEFDVQVTAADTTYRGRTARLVLVTEVGSQLTVSEALEQASLLDALTGLANRNQFTRTLTERLDAGEPPVAVLFVDLDRFKLLNDTMGHDIGDALLAAAAARIHQYTPDDGLVARLGGDEFGVIRSVRDLAEAAQFAEVIRAALERPFVLDEGEQFLSASIGVVMSDHAATTQSLLAEADAAMYAAKDAGRNAVAVADLALRQGMAEWSDTQRDLHRAIDNGEMELDLQPIVDLRSGEIAYEALARWNHPTRGRLAPAAFISVAEESGLIRRLGSHLLALGASHAARLDSPVSVNVSARQFNRTLVHQVTALIEQWQLRPGQLIIEVTESAVVDSAHAQTVLSGLREAGADVWIDDFGTGYSSLARLASLTVDGLKLAREFVNDLDSAHGWGIATAIVGIARALGIDVIAEGVETERQLEQLHLLDCDAAQGFLLGRPRPFAEELERVAPGALATQVSAAT